MTALLGTDAIVEESLWFADPREPLFGSLTAPRDGRIRGGVVLAPPLGREARAAHRAYRRLAATLADEGLLCLRFDYRGTGDSSGLLDDPRRDEAWLADIAAAVALLRSLGAEEVGAVGLRFGATLLGVAAATRDLALSALALWDPFDSGRTFLRQLSALQSLRREEKLAYSDGSVETTEYLWSAATVQEIQALSLSKAGTARPLANRVLVIERTTRAVPTALRTRLQHEMCTWTVTAEQEAFLETEPMYAELPTATSEQLVNWLSGTLTDTYTPMTRRPPVESALIGGGDGPTVRERVVRLGPNGLFGIVCEPIEAPVGPWIIGLNSVNENHIGPSRQWVELSRRWAGEGLRCLRFDTRGTGDSPLLDGEREGVVYEADWLADVPDAINAISADDPSNVVLIGLCSGAYAAIEAALLFHARGVCAVNPVLDIPELHPRAEYGDPRRRAVRARPLWLQNIDGRHPLLAKLLWRTWREVWPPADPVQVLANVVRGGTDLLVLCSPYDVKPFRKSHYWRVIGNRLLRRTNRYRVEALPALDHGLHTVEARQATLGIVDAYVLDRFARTNR